ncbi:MAG TPA: universal stress protein [Chloroflexota bacterium]|jgi:nucleotide-binding universal stress UspA family protein
MLDRILIPLDGSPAMASALPTIRQMVRGTGAKVHLLLVLPVPRNIERRGARVVYLDELMAEGHATGLGYLAQQGSALAYDGIVVSREVRFGEIVAEVLAVAQRQALHLIALAVVAQSPMQQLVRPGLAQQLMAQATVPVLVVPPSCPLVRGLGLSYGQAAA